MVTTKKWTKARKTKSLNYSVISSTTQDDQKSLANLLTNSEKE